MASHLFFYGTLMAGFERRRTSGVDSYLTYLGRGRIAARLYDLGEYPAAVPDSQAEVWGELYAITGQDDRVLRRLDTIEGFTPASPASSLYVREQSSVRLAGGAALEAWVYFYNAALDGAVPIASGDYARHLTGEP